MSWRRGPVAAAVAMASAATVALGGAGAAFGSTPSTVTPRPGATATRLPDGDVVIVGGEDTAGNAIVNVTMYDPAEGVWMAAPGLAAARMFHTATVLGDGRILIAGGTGSGGPSGAPLTTTEIFDPTSNTWTAGPAMGTAQAQVASSTSNTSGLSSTSSTSSTSAAAASAAAASAVAASAASAPAATSTSTSSPASSSSQPATTTPLGVCQAATAGALAQVDAKFALTRTLISPLGDVVAPVLAQLADVRAMLGTQMADACAPLQGLSIPVPPSG